MRVLRYVGPGEDPNHLVVETVEGSEQFSLHVSNELRAAAGSDLPRLHPVQQVEMTLSPREIQVRVRGGESPESIAEQADVAVARVMRFAGPVLEERSRITEEARRARARRSTPEGQLVQFGETVDSRFSAHGISPLDVGWDSYRRGDGQWVVTASWHGGQADRVAKWALSLTSRTVTPLDETASDLLSDRAIRPVVRAVPDVPEELEQPAPSQPSPQQRDWQPDSITTAITPLPGQIRIDEVFDQDAADLADDATDAAAAAGAAASTAEGADAQADEADPEPEVEPPPTLPLRLAEPAEAGRPRDGGRPREGGTRSSGSTSHRSGRRQVPAWDDILLGVRRNQD